MRQLWLWIKSSGQKIKMVNRSPYLALVGFSFFLTFAFQNCGTGFQPRTDLVNEASKSEALLPAPPLDASGPLALQILNAEAKQGDDLLFKVVLNKPHTNDIIISVRTEEGSAQPNVDFQSLSTNITIPAGKTEAYIPVTTLRFKYSISDQDVYVRIVATSDGLLQRALALGAVKAIAEEFNFITITAGESHTCGLTATGTVKCWGFNAGGQLGNNSTDSSVAPVDVLGLSGVKAIAAGSFHTCALLNNETVKCWGKNVNGQLGNNSTTNSLLPVDVLGLTGVTAISAGGFHTCALLANSTIQCWGRNSSGQVGNNSTIDRTVPTEVTGLDNVKAVGTGFEHSCALLNNETVKCWGDNFIGQLGNNSETDSSMPVDVMYLTGVKMIVVGPLQACAILNDEKIKCWGGISSGGGNKVSYVKPLTPTLVQGLNDSVTSLALGMGHSCAIVSDKTVKCWGSNGAGQLGNALVPEDSLVPIEIPDLNNVKAITASQNSACALINDGTVRCWGNNSSGQLGNNTSTSSKVPVAVWGLTDVKAISAGEERACALQNAGTVKCWGDGPLGNNVKSTSLTPVNVQDLNNATAIAAGNSFTCALLTDETVKCWGDNKSGQIGNNSVTDSLVPTATAGLSGVKAITAGSGHTCALIKNGTAKCWGKNFQGQIGNIAIRDYLTPQKLSTQRNIDLIVASDNRTLFLSRHILSRSGGTIISPTVNAPMMFLK